MKMLKSAALILLFSSTAVWAAPPSDESIRQLLEVTQAKNLIAGMRAQIDGHMNNAIQQELKGKTPSPAQQKAIDNLKTKAVAVVQGELDWAKLEPMYVRLYQESFSAEEVTGLLAFYQSPAGQAVIYKMPVLMQKTMTEVGKMTSAMMPKMEKVQQEFAAEMEAAK